MALLTIGLLSVGSAAALITVSSLLSSSSEELVRHSESALLATEIEARLLMYARVSRSYVERSDPALDAVRDGLARDIERGLDRARLYSGGATEDALLMEVDHAIRRFLRQRQELEEAGTSGREIAQRTRPALEQAIERLEALLVINRDNVDRARAAVARVDALSNTAGVVALALLVSGLVLVAVAVRRLVLRPLVELHGSVSAFRSDDRHARAPERGARELADLARALNEMRDALEAQRKDQLAFVAGVAHDLRNPISALKMAAASLREDLPADDREHAVGVLERQLSQLGTMVDDLLDANRIEAGELALDLRDVDVREVASTVVALYQPTTDAHEIRLRSSGAPIPVRADPVRLEQALGNLVSNAIKYTPDGGRIEVEIAAANGDATVSVADEGIGMTPEDAEEIFAPFRRRSRSTAPGAGLGLSVVRRIVRAHGGQIDVDSTPGVGSRFTIRLPRARVETAPVA